VGEVFGIGRIGRAVEGVRRVIIGALATADWLGVPARGVGIVVSVVAHTRPSHVRRRLAHWGVGSSSHGEAFCSSECVSVAVSGFAHVDLLFWVQVSGINPLLALLSPHVDCACDNHQHDESSDTDCDGRNGFIAEASLSTVVSFLQRHGLG